MEPESDLPASLAPFFWDVDFATLTWQAYPDFITRRMLVCSSQNDH